MGDPPNKPLKIIKTYTAYQKTFGEKLYGPLFFYTIRATIPGVIRVGHCFNNFCISRTPADVSGKSFADGFFIGLRIFTEQRISRHEHARCTESALDSPMVNKGLLKF